MNEDGDIEWSPLELVEGGDLHWVVSRTVYWPKCIQASSFAGIWTKQRYEVAWYFFLQNSAWNVDICVCYVLINLSQAVADQKASLYPNHYQYNPHSQ